MGRAGNRCLGAHAYLINDAVKKRKIAQGSLPAKADIFRAKLDSMTARDWKRVSGEVSCISQYVSSLIRGNLAWKMLMKIGLPPNSSIVAGGI
jgi:hypothetical protein